MPRTFPVAMARAIPTTCHEMPDISPPNAICQYAGDLISRRSPLGRAMADDGVGR